MFCRLQSSIDRHWYWKRSLVQHSSQKSNTGFLDGSLGFQRQLSPRAVRLQHHHQTVSRSAEKRGIGIGIDLWSIDQYVVEVLPQFSDARLKALEAERRLPVTVRWAIRQEPQVGFSLGLREAANRRQQPLFVRNLSGVFHLKVPAQSR